MTDEQRQKITNLRAAGNGYKKIGKVLGLSEDTVKSFCPRRKLSRVVVKSNVEVTVCKCCGKPVPQTQGRKQKKFKTYTLILTKPAFCQLTFFW